MENISGMYITFVDNAGETLKLPIKKITLNHEHATFEGELR